MKNPGLVLVLAAATAAALVVAQDTNPRRRGTPLLVQEGTPDEIYNYPYTEFDVVSTPMMALGIEYPGIVGIAIDIYDLDSLVYGLPAPNDGIGCRPRGRPPVVL